MKPIEQRKGVIPTDNDTDALRSAYEAYARNLINRRVFVPPKLVSETLKIAREDGAAIRKKPNEIFDNSFVENLEKSGFMKELWGGTLPQERTTP